MPDPQQPSDDPVSAMHKAVKCLALEPPESVHRDVTAHWARVLATLQEAREVLTAASEFVDDVRFKSKLRHDSSELFLRLQQAILKLPLPS